MSAPSLPWPLVRCPDRESLVEFNLGKLSSPDSDVIARHLAHCRHCETVLQEIDASPLDASSDPVLRNLQDCFGPQPIVDEPGCQFLQAAVRALGGTATVNRSPAPAGTALYDRAQEEPWVGKWVGNYEILDLIGKGGMGVVFEARQATIERIVALKMIQMGAFSGRSAMHRFRTEGQAIARLHHANVVQIYEFGEEDGVPYFSMERVHGGSLARKIAKGQMPFRESAQLLATIARAVHYAHERQVIHRDLKPGNILVDEAGVPKVTDFGLAKLLDLNDEQTRSEQVLGTPTYMAPEQALASDQRIHPAVDIYSLGVILYEMLTDCPPFRGPSKADIILQLLHDEPLPPSLRRKKVPADLEAICLKCLEKKPENRYATAEALAEDLERWLQGKPTLARPAPWYKKAWQSVKRHKYAACLTVALACLLSVGYLAQAHNYLPDIEAELRQGKSVTLIEATGRPKWFRIATAQDKTQTSYAADGAFSVHTWGLCLVELLPDSLHDSYRITGEVRHERSDLKSEVGFYFAHEALPGTHKEHHFFMHAGFNDLKAIGEVVSEPTPEQKANQRLGMNWPRMFPIWYCEKLDKNPGHSGFGGTNGPVFKPAGVGRTGWRTFDITVTPKVAKASWEGQAIGELHEAQIADAHERALAYAKSRVSDDPLIVQLHPRYRGRGGLGLYLDRSSASFRNVVIAPQSNQDRPTPDF